MYIGLFDQDLLLNPNSFIPSLELMKYAYYFKKNKNIVKMFYDANENKPYDKIILNNNTGLNNTIPKLLLLDNRVIWVGKTFFGGRYSLLPKEIEESFADKSIYQSFFEKNKGCFSKKQKENLSSFLNNGFPCRLTFDNQLIFDLDKISSTENKLYLYDDNFFEYPSFREILSKFHFLKAITFINPQKISDLDLFFKMQQDNIKFHGWKNKQVAIYTGNLNKKDFFKNYKYFNRKFNLSFPDDPKEEVLEYFLIKQLILKGNYFLFGAAKNHKIFLSPNQNLNYNYDSVLLKIIEYYCKFTRATGKSKDMNFYSFVKKENKSLEKEVYFYGKKEPELNKIFSANLKKISEAGVWLL